jgi:hypothetical protein
MTKSATRISTWSTRPLRNPAMLPYRIPKSTKQNGATMPMNSETRAPYISRASRSRPR